MDRLWLLAVAYGVSWIGASTGSRHDQIGAATSAGKKMFGALDGPEGPSV